MLQYLLICFTLKYLNDFAKKHRLQDLFHLAFPFLWVRACTKRSDWVVKATDVKYYDSDIWFLSNEGASRQLISQIKVTKTALNA